MKSLQFLIAFCLCFPWSAFAAAPLPNIVIIFIDDQGYGDIGPFGATKQRTPNLDRMAREGMKLTINKHPAITCDRAKEIFPGIIKDLKFTAL